MSHPNDPRNGLSLWTWTILIILNNSDVFTGYPEEDTVLWKQKHKNYVNILNVST